MNNINHFGNGKCVMISLMYLGNVWVICTCQNFSVRFCLMWMRKKLRNWMLFMVETWLGWFSNIYGMDFDVWSILWNFLESWKILQENTIILYLNTIMLNKYLITLQNTMKYYRILQNTMKYFRILWNTIKYQFFIIFFFSF